MSAATDVAPPGAIEEPAPERDSPPSAELLLIGWAFLLLVTVIPQTYAAFYTPKLLLVLCIIGPGLVIVVRGVLAGDRIGLAALGFVAVAALSSLFADVPAMSVVGLYQVSAGLILVACLPAVWGAGRAMSQRGREWLVIAITAGAVANALLAWFQVAIDFQVGWLKLFQGRALATMGNPVHLGALCAVGAVLAAYRARKSARAWMWLICVAVLAGAVQLSGSRIAVVIMIAATALLVVWTPRLRIGFVLAAIVVGILLALALPDSGVSASSTDRFGASASSGVTPRLRSWESALEAVGSRPLLGYGPGRYFVATGPRNTAELARTGGDSPDALFADAHNFVVEYLTTTGIIGVALLLVWLVGAARRARGPLVWFAAVVAVTLLLQPQYFGLTPIAALALGAAGPPWPKRTPDEGEGESGSTWRDGIFVGLAVVTGVAGLVLGGLWLSGDIAYSHGISRVSIAEIDRAVERMPPWPDPVQVKARAEGLIFQRTGAPGIRDRALGTQRDAIDRDPAQARLWNQYGLMAQAFGRPRVADRAFVQALRRNPWSNTALQGRYELAIRGRGDAVTERRMRAKLCELGPTYCPRRRPSP